MTTKIINFPLNIPTNLTERVNNMGSILQCAGISIKTNVVPFTFVFSISICDVCETASLSPFDALSETF